MADYNRIILLGNLTRDPELSYLPNNTPVVKLGLAVNRKFKRQDGEQGEETLFIDCEAFARIAEVMNQHLRKGSPVFVEGRLKLDRWQDRDGTNRQKHRVHIEQFKFVGGDGGNNSQPQQPPQQGGGFDADGSDIPFAPDVPEVW